MGTDIHTVVETKDPATGRWEMVKGLHPFEWRDYSIFGFLGNVRNDSECEPLSDHRGLPEGLSEGGQVALGYREDYHSHSWVMLKELLDFDYDKMFWDRRHDSDEEERQVTYREHLLEDFFRDLDELKLLGGPEHVRVIFWFDN